MKDYSPRRILCPSSLEDLERGKYHKDAHFKSRYNMLHPKDIVYFLSVIPSQHKIKDFDFPCEYKIVSLDRFITVDADNFNRYYYPIIAPGFINVFEQILDELKIDAFYCRWILHLRILSSLQKISQILMKPKYYHTVSPMWCEMGLLRPGIPFKRLPDICFQADWLGVYHCGSLAKVKPSDINEMSKKHKDLLYHFMVDTFLPSKYEHNKIIFNSKKQLENEFSTTKPITLIALQRIGDVLLNYVPPLYRNRDWSVSFAEAHPDCFFIIKDHPIQEQVWEFAERGKNWIYLPPKNNYDAISMCLNANVVLTVNSSLGVESLFWTPVVRIGQGAWMHDEISYGLKDFHSDLPLRSEAINKFLCYAITRYHITLGVNAHENRLCEWLEWRERYRLKQSPREVRPSLPTIAEIKELATPQ